MGQTVDAPLVDSVLDSFSFSIQSDEAFDFTAKVAEWDFINGGAGPVVFTSSLTSITPSFDFNEYVINTGGLSLTAGAKYVLFFDAADSGSGGASILMRSDNPYGPGIFAYSDNGVGWDSLGGNYDAAFTANFSAPEVSAVPLPAAVWGGFVLMGALGLNRLRRRVD